MLFGIVLSFNTLYVVGSKKPHYMYRFNFFVSIHYMLLVQKTGILAVNIEFEFQYIICCWFNYLDSEECKQALKFQYIICCWFKLHFIF